MGKVSTNMCIRKNKIEMLNTISTCEKCGSENLSCVDSRMYQGTRRRRRICIACGNRSTTYEITKEDLEYFLEEVKL